MVEIFSDRIEFSNAGSPLVSIERIVDTVRYREMRIWQGLCINVVFAKNVEVDLTKSLRLQSHNEMLAPRIENQNNQFTKVVLFCKGSV